MEIYSMSSKCEWGKFVSEEIRKWISHQNIVVRFKIYVKNYVIPRDGTESLGKCKNGQ